MTDREFLLELAKALEKNRDFDGASDQLREIAGKIYSIDYNKKATDKVLWLPGVVWSSLLLILGLILGLKIGDKNKGQANEIYSGSGYNQPERVS